MKNIEYVIYIATKYGRTYNYYKEPKNWVQVSPVGITRACTAEQVLSHLLPALLSDDFTVNVKQKATL